MFFFNLSLPEFLAILGSLSGLVVALYLLDRMRKRYTVATLRFFAANQRPPVLKHRRKLQQPWSLLLQLLSLLLLLLAIAQLRLGSPLRYSRDHVLILDVSPWMAARLGPNRLIDRARADARAYVSALPLADRVMVVRAGVLATPALLFESDRKKIDLAIDETQPGAASLNLQGALDFARRAQRVQSDRPGEIVFIGAARVPAEEAARLDPPSNFRFISIAGPTEHIGLRKMTVHRAVDDPDVWEVFLAAKNYGSAPRIMPVVVNFGGSPVATHRFDLKPGAEESFSFRFRTRARGWLEARLASPDAALQRDSFRQDGRAILELPARGVAPVTIYSAEPELLRPVFTAIPGIQANFLAPSKYDPNIHTGIVVFDRFAPASPPSADSIWLEPPADKSPIPVQNTEASVKLNQWQEDHPLAAGLRARDIEISGAEIFRSEPGDISIARSDAGPLIVARPGAAPGQPKMVVLGFHPMRSGLKYQLTTPLLFANIIRWMAPGAFRSWELTAGAAGTVDVDLESDTDPNLVRVQTEDGQPLPFTIQGKALRFFTAAPGIVRVLTGDRELVYSLTLPQPGDTVWQPSPGEIRQGVKLGLPGRAPLGPASRDIWQWLALAGAAGLIADWILFGRMDRRFQAARAAASNVFWRKAS
ncbi:MAG TPA: VWA domain-containing protein [Bryobacteraceae bacterium]|nr:VWA domain-containing protein [Bryobacteraceae bacterium]